MSDVYMMTMGMVAPADAEPDAKAILDKTQQKLGFVPNMYGAMANLPALLQTYIYGYDLFRRVGGFTPVEQEVVFLAISRENGCRYCVAAHSVVADTSSKVPAAVTDAIRRGEPLPDKKLDALCNFARVMTVGRGKPSGSEVNKFLEAGYTEKHILSVILAIGVKTYSNYTNHIFHTPVDKVFEGRVWVSSAA